MMTMLMAMTVIAIIIMVVVTSVTMVTSMTVFTIIRLSTLPHAHVSMLVHTHVSMLVHTHVSTLVHAHVSAMTVATTTAHRYITRMTLRAHSTAIKKHHSLSLLLSKTCHTSKNIVKFRGKRIQLCRRFISRNRFGNTVISRINISNGTTNRFKQRGIV